MAKKQRLRSPSYPAIDLKTAIQLVVKLYPAAKHALGVDVIAEEWGYKSGKTASPYIAALKYFGLLKEEKSNDNDRMLRLTDLALDIAVDPNEHTTERKTAIETAALKPPIHQELWKQWGAELPPEGEMRRYLERERGFNPKYVGRFIGEYQKTIAFAKLCGPGIIEGDEGEETKSGASVAPVVPVKPQNSPQSSLSMTTTPIIASTCETGSKQDVFTLDEGPVVLQWPGQLSSESFEDLSGWWEIMLRKIKRSVQEHNIEKE
ncbi:MAG: hypothetical protein JXM70_28230 [Pirellulales bacterium]|nr:hypothetical protein [Pirellulales bacterium]